MNLQNKFLFFLKIGLIFSLFSSVMLAEERPTIALVLSGGGARGGAHVGVLKVLEEKKIPIDFIVGTSMGSFVGGLYASGKSPNEIETLLTKTDWKVHIRTDLVREDTPMRKKEMQYQYQGRVGLGVDANNNVVLPTGVLKRQPMLLKFEEEFEHVNKITDFNKLSIPFRAIATNIQNGEAVVLDSGSLARSVYASSSIPGGFQPININGIDLVDGGVSDNIPIGVAKKMGADIIIAVDVSENFDKDLNVNSYLVVMGQLVNILMRKNANESIATLNSSDILITPNLDGYGGLDADKYKGIIQTGVVATRELYETKLKHLSLNAKEYDLYAQQHKLNVSKDIVLIDAIAIDNPTYIDNEVILGRLRLKVGDALDNKILREDILHIYNMGIFDEIDHKIVEKDGKNILEIRTTPSWDNHGEIRLALGLEDDFDGHSAYSLKFGYTMFGINKYGAEWKNDIEIGRRERISSEFYQPLGVMQRWYIKPSLSYSDINELIPASSVERLEGEEGSLDMSIRRQGASLALGTYLFRDYELEASLAAYEDRNKVELLSLQNEYNAVPLTVALKIDNLDDLHFPKTGFRANIIWTKEMDDFGSDYDYEQIYLNVEKPVNIGAHNITAYLKYGSTYQQNGVSSLAGNFHLGGLFNLSGFVPYSLTDENMFLGVLKYRYQIRDGGFFGSLNTPLYAGFSVETGNTWGQGESINDETMHKSGTVYIAADTILGPFYFAYGFSETNDDTVYLYLGEKF